MAWADGEIQADELDLLRAAAAEAGIVDGPASELFEKLLLDPYATAVRRLGLDPSSCVAIEDTQRGIDAANAAGVRCFACTSPLTHGTSFAGAVEVLDSVRELPTAMKRLDRG